MSKRNIIELEGRDASADPLSGLLQAGAQKLIHQALVPPYVRKTKSLEAALPWLYLKGISTGEMSAALEVLVGPNAKGLSASTVSHSANRLNDIRSICVSGCCAILRQRMTRQKLPLWELTKRVFAPTENRSRCGIRISQSCCRR